jgi:hypothetical protein
LRVHEETSERDGDIASAEDVTAGGKVVGDSAGDAELDEIRQRPA